MNWTRESQGVYSAKGPGGRYRVVQIINGERSRRWSYWMRCWLDNGVTVEVGGFAPTLRDGKKQAFEAHTKARKVFIP